MAQNYLNLTALFEHAPIFVIVASVPEYRIQYANRAYHELVMRSDLVGRTVNEALPDAVEQGYIDLLERTCRSAEPMVVRDSPFWIQPGAAFPKVLKYVDYIYQPISGPQGDVIAVLCTGSDVTEEHNAAREAMRLEEELYSTRRSVLVEGLASSLAHELNQPLSAATNYLGAADALLKADDTNSSVREMIIAAQGQVQRAGEIIAGLRALTGTRLARRENANLRAIVDQAVETVTASGACQETRIENRVEADLEICCDPAQIFKVMANLLRNACQATRGELGPVRITSRAGNDGTLEILVDDRGSGFSEDMLTQGPSIGKTTTGGLGVGLVLCQTIAEAHGGHLALENTGNGGRVRVSLSRGT